MIAGRGRRGDADVGRDLPIRRLSAAWPSLWMGSGLRRVSLLLPRKDAGKGGAPFRDHDGRAEERSLI